jgi:hypothetical protein
LWAEIDSFLDKTSTSWLSYRAVERRARMSRNKGIIMDMQGIELRSTNYRALGAVALVFFLLIARGGVAIAAETHTFDPVLSLTGDCSTALIDPVADPGLCPMPPGVPGVDHPNQAFSSPRAVATDSYGNVYVASFGQAESGSEGRIDVFDSSGLFITEVAVPAGAKNLAVDEDGSLYVIDGKNELLRYPPSGTYKPETGKITYGNSPETVAGPSASFFVGLAIDPETQRVFANYGHEVIEYGSATEGNKVIESIGKGTLSQSFGVGLAIDEKRGRIYASDRQPPAPGEPAGSGLPVIRIFELESPHALVGTIDGSTTPEGKFLSDRTSVAVEESTGDVFVYDGEGAEVVYEFTEDGEYISTLEYALEGRYVYGAEIAVDNGKNSPNGALNPFSSYLYVPAFPVKVGHVFAFGPPKECAPKLVSSSFDGVTEDEAQLHATINPCALETSYTFEYLTQEQFEEEGETFAGAQVANAGQLPAGASPVEVFAVVEGLLPGTAYRFRAVAENEKGSAEEQGEFATYPEELPSPPCLNDPLRKGASALLPDCRAYELVTPSDTNARTPIGVGLLGTYFATREASPTGDAVSFEIQGGSLPGDHATGSLAGDPYVARRTEEGWRTSYVGPTGGEAVVALPGSNSPDQGYSLWSTAGSEGSAAIGGATSYLQYPDGHSALVGRGSLGTDPGAVGKLISEGGGHVVFVSPNNDEHPAVQLEEDAPAGGTQTIYDRTIDQSTGEEETHVVSLLPGDVTPGEGKKALYEGASLDGKGVVFRLGEGSHVLYLRYNDEETYEVAEEATFAGIAEGGKRVFYLKGGNLFAFEVGGEENPIAFSSSGDVTPVNVAADGDVAYFVSPGVLTGEPNPIGSTPKLGAENLYRSEEGALSFIGTVTERDVDGLKEVDGLGLWTEAVGPGFLGADPSRTTADGGVLLFESRADLVGYDPQGHAEIYRYDFAHGELSCLSCSPTLKSAEGSASLQSVKQTMVSPEPFSAFGYTANLSTDGRRAFFQTPEALVASDTDGLQDVYEWEAQGVGTCQTPAGCTFLISSGQSKRTDYLYAVSDSGNDLFFRSGDLLLPSDTDETPSIYDAKVGGGFPEEAEEECLAEGCRPSLSPAPVLPSSESSGYEGSGNIEEPKHCPKGTHRAAKNGKTRCVKKHHHRKAGAKKKGAGK